MPIIEIDGIGRVELGDEFMRLSPEQQNATVQEIAASAAPSATSAGDGKSVTVAPRTGFVQTTKNEFNEGVGSVVDGKKGAIEALREPHSAAGGVKFAKGVGNALLGTMQAAFSPLTAGVRTQVAEPVEDATGIPAALTEFAATLALPTGKAKAVNSLGDIVKAAKDGFTEVRSSAASFSPHVTDALADHVQAVLKKNGSYPHLADSVHKTVDILRKGAPSSADELRSVQEALSALKIDPDPKIRRAAKAASDEIHQFIVRTEPQLAKTLETANANYAAAKRAEEINAAREIAGLRTGRAGYGGNAVNNMRQVLSPKVEAAIKGNPKGYNPEEIQAMRAVVEGNTSTNTLRGIGQLSPAKGAIQTGLAIGTGGISALIGASANKLATVLTAKQIDALSQLVQSRAPASQRVFNPMRDWYSASEKFGMEPTPKNLARLTLAARNFASNLEGAGISVQPDALVRSGLVAAPAPSEQEPAR